MKKTYNAPVFEETLCTVESEILTGSQLVEDGSLTYYLEEDNQFA